MSVIGAYACCHKENDVRLSSSSGAVFFALAEEVLLQNGSVYGVAMSEDCRHAEFIRVTEKESLKKIQSSKYLQAKVSDSYRQVKKDLAEGRPVLFTGTACQVNGLKALTGNDCGQLICADVVCHGVPSPALWEKYVMYQEERFQHKLKSINFRCKGHSGTDFEKTGNKVYISKNKDGYMQMFLRDVCLRPSCYECKAKEEKRSDLTIGDFWGVAGVAPEMDDGRGTSLVLIRTEQGRKIFEKICPKLKVKKVSGEDCVRLNPAEYRSTARPEERETFFADFRAMTFPQLEEKYAGLPKPTFKRKVKQTVKKILLKNRPADRFYAPDYGLMFEFDDTVQ